MKKILIIIAVLILIIAGKLVLLSYLDLIPPINETTKTCLVTGASSGIGREISKEMAKQGWKVIGIARRKNKLKKLALELGNKFIPYTCDVSNPKEIHQVSETIKQQKLRPTLFFLNAGIGAPSAKFEPMFSKHKQTFDTNYFGVISWIDNWINDVKNFGGGTFIATSSVSSLFATPGAAGYSASKAAVNNCFQSLRLDYRDNNIGFAIVLPGPVATEMLKTPKPLPFTHDASDEAKYIIQQVFNRKKQIEPSWFYSSILRFLNWLPDIFVIKLLGTNSQVTIEWHEITHETYPTIRPILESLETVNVNAFLPLVKPYAWKHDKRLVNVPEEKRPFIEEKVTSNIIQSLKSKYKEIITKIETGLQNKTLPIVYLAIAKDNQQKILGFALFKKESIKTNLSSRLLNITEGSRDQIDSTPDQDQLYVYVLAVDPKAQKKGVGKKLVFSAFQYCPKIKNLFLKSSAHESNKKTQGFYEHIGFIPVLKGIFNAPGWEREKIVYMYEK